MAAGFNYLDIEKLTRIIPDEEAEPFGLFMLKYCEVDYDDMISKLKVIKPKEIKEFVIKQWIEDWVTAMNSSETNSVVGKIMDYGIKTGTIDPYQVETITKYSPVLDKKQKRLTKLDYVNLATLITSSVMKILATDYFGMDDIQLNNIEKYYSEKFSEMVFKIWAYQKENLDSSNQMKDIANILYDLAAKGHAIDQDRIEQVTQYDRYGHPCRNPVIYYPTDSMPETTSSTTTSIEDEPTMRIDTKYKELNHKLIIELSKNLGKKCKQKMISKIVPEIIGNINSKTMSESLSKRPSEHIIYNLLDKWYQQVTNKCQAYRNICSILQKNNLASQEDSITEFLQSRVIPKHKKKCE